MSSSIGNVGGGGFGIIQQLIANSAAIRSNVNILTDQASSGFVSRNYAGLGDNAAVALNLKPQLNDLKTWQTNISQATGAMTVTQAAMKQMQTIASTFLASTNNLNGLNASELDSVAANARSALQEVAGLLDTQNGTMYVFGGVDSTNPPVLEPDSILTSGFLYADQCRSGVPGNQWRRRNDREHSNNSHLERAWYFTVFHIHVAAGVAAFVAGGPGRRRANDALRHAG